MPELSGARTGPSSTRSSASQRNPPSSPSGWLGYGIARPAAPVSGTIQLSRPGQQPRHGLAGYFQQVSRARLPVTPRTPVEVMVNEPQASLAILPVGAMVRV